MMTPQPFLTEVARAFEDAPAIVNGPDNTAYLEWTNQGLNAGVTSNGLAAWVYLGDAYREVTSVKMAVRALQAIFADQLVALAAFDDGAMMSCELASATDAYAAFDRMPGKAEGDMPEVDSVWLRSWSGALDRGAQPPISATVPSEAELAEAVEKAEEDSPWSRVR